MPHPVAAIIIDTGFSQESLADAQVIAFYDLLNGRTAAGAPFLTSEQIRSFAGDPHGHGSEVLGRLRQITKELPLVLIRAFRGGQDSSLIRTGFANGRQVSPGWTEAYIAAVELCQKLGYSTVANCSFGGYTHACDGTGWESFQLGRVTGPGRPGHIVVAAAGPGDGRAAHASWLTFPGEATSIRIFQEGTTTYNFWAGLPAHGQAASKDAPDDWALAVYSYDGVQAVHYGSQIVPNFWNGCRQLTFTVDGAGLFELKLERKPVANGAQGNALQFDCWTLADGSSYFLNHVDPQLIAEPAVFPQVLAVGLSARKYSGRQAAPDEKPEVLLGGSDAISFRIPEVTAAVAALLASDPLLDIKGVRALLGKYPQLERMFLS
jgi:hypothetical protein